MPASARRPRSHPCWRFASTTLVLFLLISANAVGAQSPVAEPALPPTTLTVVAFACPAGFDPASGGAQAAFDTCTQPLEGMTYTVTSQDPAYPAAQRVTDPNGAASWADLPAGAGYSVAQSMNAGTGDPWVYCRYADPRDGSGAVTETFTLAPGGQTDAGITDPLLTGYATVVCSWFQQPTAIAAFAPESGTRLDIRAWLCPFHFDAAAASIDQLYANCTRPHRDARFDIISNGNPPLQGATGSIGSVSFQSVPYGEVTIRQLDYASYDPARVFCYTLPYTAPHGPLQPTQESVFFEEPGDTFSLTIEVNPGDAIDCIWFDAHITEDNLGTLLIRKFVCPDGFDAAAGGLTELTAGCPTPQKGYLQLLRSGGISGNETDANGFLGFINYSPGMYTVRETAPLGYATARIFCRSYNADDWNHVVDPWIEQPVTDKIGFTVQLQAHWETECLWFDVEGVNHGYLDVFAWSCPIGFAPTASTPRLTFAQQCQVGVSGATFAISSFPNFSLTATSANGAATFQEHVPVGDLSIAATGPPTFTFVQAFCGSAPFIGIGAIPTTWTSYPVAYTRYDVPVGYQVVCEFYYRPIVITGDVAASPAAEIENATEETLGEGTSGANETAEPTAAPTPDASSPPSPDDTAAPQPTTVPDGSGSPPIVAVAGAATEPAASDAPSVSPGDAATLAITALTCPAGYDPYAPGASPADDCLDPAPGITLALAGTGNEAMPGTTGPGGTVIWTGLAPGIAIIQRAPAPETAASFLFGCQSAERPLDPIAVTPIVFADPQGRIAVNLLPGETLTCRWFDIPAMPDAT